MMRRLIFPPCFLLLTVLGPLCAAELVSGPPAGTPVTPVSCYANSGPFAGREQFDAAAQIGQGPGAFLFVHVLNRNTAPVIRGVEALSMEFRLFGFKCFVVSLVADRTQGEEQLLRVNRSLQLSQPMVISLDGMEGPGNYALNRRCTLSLVVIDAGKVVDSLAFTDTGIQDLARIRVVFEKAIGDIPTDRAGLLARARAGLPTDPNALRELAANQALALYRSYQQQSRELENGRQGMTRANRPDRAMNRRAGRDAAEGSARRANAPPADRPASAGETQRVRRGQAPADATLNTLLRTFIRMENADGRNDEIFADILSRGRESEALQAEVVAMFQLMLSFPDRYGTAYAQGLATAFLKEQGRE